VTRYELLDRIGVGGMAEIFRGKAVAAGGFEKPVAIKRILPHLSADARFVELLIAEAKVLSLLKHRNIVQIFDVGLGDDGQYFLVMEYVDGKDLGAVQRGIEAGRRRIPFDLALHIGAEICEALEHAHSARAPDGKPMSLVHRDVSPSNVLLSRAGEVKLTDFGIAKRAEQETTGHGAVRGKFAYISPEQARNEHLEPRSDVFSVGILLWELVTSRRLFSSLGDLEALRAVRETQVPRPRDFDTWLSPEIDALIMATLAPEPRVRPTAGQLGAKLRSLRYALEVTVGDPATELARFIDAAEEEVERQSPQPAAPAARAEFEGSEATVIRIHTADAFSMRDKDGAGVARAREVIDRFEEEETRQAQLSRDQMAFLRASAQRDSGELASAVEPPLPGVRPTRASEDPPLPGVRSRRPSNDPPLPSARSRRTTDEPTRAHAPVSTEDVPTLYPAPPDPSPSFNGDEATRLLVPAGRRTPSPERMGQPRPPTQPPPIPGPQGGRMLPPTPAPLQMPPGTVHDRSGRGAPSAGAAMSHPVPPTAVTPVMAQPPILQPPPPMPQVPMPPHGVPIGQPPIMQPPVLPPPGLPIGQPPMMQPPALQPPGQPPMPPHGNYPNWGRPSLPLGASPAMQAMYDRQPPQRPQASAQRFGNSRRTPLRPWMLVIGALIMALLAFAVTRACIHTATSRPASESR
jgi:serine/threonine protein kinase